MSSDLEPDEPERAETASSPEARMLLARAMQKVGQDHSDQTLLSEAARLADSNTV
jgi:hypothetical protein